MLLQRCSRIHRHHGGISNISAGGEQQSGSGARRGLWMRIVNTTYRDGRGRGRSLGGESLLSGRPLRLRLTGWRIGATRSLALSHDGLELLQLLVFHPKLVLHFQLHRVNASVLHSEEGEIVGMTKTKQKKTGQSPTCYSKKKYIARTRVYQH